MRIGKFHLGGKCSKKIGTTLQPEKCWIGWKKHTILMLRSGYVLVKHICAALTCFASTWFSRRMMEHFSPSTKRQCDGMTTLSLLSERTFHLQYFKRTILGRDSWKIQ